MRLLPVLLALSFLARDGGAQRDAQRDAQRNAATRAIQDATARGEFDRARSLLERTRLPLPERHLLDAAARPPHERAAAMLTVAQLHADQALADTALVAGATALLTVRGQHRWVSALEVDDHEISEAEQERIVAGLAGVLAHRERQGGDPEALREARWMLTSLATLGADPSLWRVAAGASLPVPAPLAAALTVRFVPYGAVRDPWLFDRDGGDGPAVGPFRLEAGVVNAPLPVPPPGAYLLELVTAGGRRVLRRLLVSDLDVTMQRLRDCVVLMATARGQALAGRDLVLELFEPERCPSTIRVRTDARGVATFTLPAGFTGDWRSSATVRVRAGEHQTVTHLPGPAHGGEMDEWTAHLCVDRPWYRPGETVRGRVVVRRRGGADGMQMAAGVALRLTLWDRTPDRLVRDVCTDAHGFAGFELELPAEAPQGSAHLRVQHAGSEPGRALLGENAFEVTGDRRPPVLVTVEAPPIARADGPSWVRIHVQHAAGTPAGGTRIDVVARAAGLEDRATLVLDAAGIGLVPLALHELPSVGRQYAVVDVAIHAPDGQILREQRTLEVVGAPVPATRARDVELSLPAARARAGTVVPVDVVGPPRARVLLSASDPDLLATQSFVLDDQGRARCELATAASWWPNVTLRASSPAGGAQARLELDPEAGPLSVAIEAPAPAVLPGAAASVGFRVTDPAGRGVESTLTVAIVDETVFTLLADRTRDPVERLTPWRSMDRWLEATQSAELTEPIAVLGSLLAEGKLCAPRGIGQPGAGGPATPGPGGSVLAWREDLRPTACFVAALRTDRSGRAQLSCRMPDGLTHWRITAIAVDDGARAAMARAAFATQKPLAVTAILPRLLRVGDQLTVPLLAHWHGDDPAGRVPAPVAAHVDAQGSAELVVGAPADRVFDVTAGRAVASPWTLRGAQAGAGTLLASVRSTAHDDGVRLSLPVLADEVRQPLSKSACITGKTTLGLALPGAPVRARSITLLGSRDALLAEAAQKLHEYPHGCVEQTIARLMPLIAAARAARASGQAAPELAAAHRQRIAAGFARLRQLRVGAANGFAFWPGGAVDPRMTAIVIQALCDARAAGFDPAAHGLVVEPAAGGLAATIAALQRADGRLRPALPDGPETVDAELVIACLRYRPGLDNARAAVAAMLGQAAALPEGLVARAGLALHAAGDGAGARLALRRLTRNPVDAGSGCGAAAGATFLGEQPAARAAAALELALALEAGALRAGALARLLAQARDGWFGTTYGTARALCALALDAERSRAAAPVAASVAASEAAIEVAISGCGQDTTVVLDRANGFRLTLPLSGTGDLELRAPAAAGVLAVLRGETTWPGSTMQPRHEQLEVTRTLARITFDAEGKERCEPVRDEVRVGELLEVAITVRGTRAHEYVVVECPLPAGFELAGDATGLERHDDRFVYALSRVHTVAQGRNVRVVAAHAGTVAWPPVVATAMYDDEPFAIGAGQTLRVTAAPPAAVRAVTPLLGRATFDAAVAELEEQLVRSVERGAGIGQAFRGLDRLCGGAGWERVRQHRDALVQRSSEPLALSLELEGRGLAPDWLRELRAHPERIGPAIDHGIAAPAPIPVSPDLLEELVFAPFRDLVEECTSTGDFVHEAHAEVAPRLLAWRARFERAIEWHCQHVDEPPPELLDEADWTNRMGAAPGPSLRWAWQLAETARVRLLSARDQESRRTGVAPRAPWFELLGDDRDTARAAAMVRSWFPWAIDDLPAPDLFEVVQGLDTHLAGCVQDLLLRYVTFPVQDYRQAVWESLTPASIATLPQSVLIEGLGSGPFAPIAAGLLPTAAGRRAVLLWLAAGNAADTDRLADSIQGDDVDAATLPGLLGCGPTRRVAELLATSTLTSPALLAALDGDVGRDALVAALRQRGVADPRLAPVVAAAEEGPAEPSRSQQLQQALRGLRIGPDLDPAWLGFGFEVPPPDAASLGRVFARRRGIWLP